MIGPRAFQISSHDRETLRAALLSGAEADAAFRTWVRDLDLDTVDFATLRLIPLIAEKAARRNGQRPDDIVASLQKIARFGWLTSQFEVSHALRDAAALTEAGIDLLATKGLAVIALSDATVALRPMDDIDLCVPRSHARRALDILMEEGYGPDPWIEVTPMWQQRGPAWFIDHFHSIDLVTETHVKIDLHWHPISSRPTSRVTKHMWSGAVPATIDGCDLLVMNRSDTVVHTIVHAQFDRNVGPRWVADAALLIGSGDDDFDWDRLVLTAQVCAASGVVRAGLVHLENVLTLPIPPQVTAALRRQSRREAPLHTVRPISDFVRRHRPAMASAMRSPRRAASLAREHLAPDRTTS